MPAVAPSLTGVRTHVEADADGKQRCLRLLPGTHRRWHQLHGMGEAHAKDINRIDDAIDPRFADYPGEVDVPVAAETWWWATPACSTPPTPTPPASTGR